MNTRNRPGIVTCEVRRAPLVPSGSLTTWTTISWPSLSSSSIFWVGAIPTVALRPAAAAAAVAAGGAAALLVVVAGELVELVQRVDDVGDVEEAVALEAEIDEGGLHAGQDFRDPALVDVADDAAVAFALDEDFGDQVVLENGHHRLVAVRGDDHLLVHHELLHAGLRSARRLERETFSRLRVSS